MRLSSVSVFILLLALGWAFGGCQSNPHSDPGAALEKNIRKGMTPEEVVAILGEPIEKRPLADPDLTNGEEWLFRLNLRTLIGMKEVEMQQRPYIDPLTGEQTMVLDPVARPEVKYVTRRIHLYFADGEVIGWTVEDYNRLEYE